MTLSERDLVEIYQNGRGLRLWEKHGPWLMLPPCHQDMLPLHYCSCHNATVMFWPLTVPSLAPNAWVQGQCLIVLAVQSTPWRDPLDQTSLKGTWGKQVRLWEGNGCWQQEYQETECCLSGGWGAFPNEPSASVFQKHLEFICHTTSYNLQHVTSKSPVA